jgi:NAD(P)-dependent dehydrogenase (short-subunit alcohol dehydrogenase family)
MSKAALEAIVLTYAAESAGTSVAANLFNPGPLRTRMRQKAMPGEDPESLESPETAAPLILELLAPDCMKNGELVSLG